MEFRTIKGVPIVSTGTYKLGTGETTFSADDLAAAVLAANDPTVTVPRIKIGHLDERFENDPALDGEPAMGTVRNMALSDDGQTIIGDLCDVPAWLADSMHSAYPGRSVEGGFGYTAASGRTYPFVISDLALLGTTWPGVGSLPDLQAVLEHNGPVGNDVQAKAETFVSVRAAASKVSELDEEDQAECARLMREGKTEAQAIAIVERSSDERNEERQAERQTAKRAAAALDVGAIPRTFAADLDAGKVPTAGADASAWWPRSVEASDDGALSILVDTGDGLLRLPITVADKALTYGEPVTVAASTGSLDNLKGPRVLASWPSNNAASRPEEVNTMKLDVNVDKSKLIAALGLSEDADEAAIHTALGVDVGAAPDETATAPAQPVAASGKLPDGIVAIDAERLAALEVAASAGASVAAERQTERDEADIRSAIEGGRIVAASAEDWRKRFEVDREGTHKLLTASADDGGLAAVIPVTERGTSAQADNNVLASAPRVLPELRDEKTEVAA